MDITPWIKWHCEACKGKHGLLTHILPQDEWKIKNQLEALFGKECYWSADIKGRVSIEFVNRKEYPEVKTPWGLCGETMIFGGWRQDTIQQERELLRFDPGDRVIYSYCRGGHISGVITRKHRGRLHVYMEKNKMTYFLLPQDIHLIKKGVQL